MDSKQVRIPTKGLDTLERIARAVGKTKGEVAEDAAELLKDYLIAKAKGIRIIYEDPNKPEERIQLKILGYDGVKIE